MLTLWSHVVSSYTGSSEGVREMQITVLESTAAKAREEEVKTNRPGGMFTASQPGL